MRTARLSQAVIAGTVLSLAACQGDLPTAEPPEAPLASAFCSGIPDRVWVSPGSATIALGGTGHLSANVYDTTNCPTWAPLSWSSSNYGVVSVSGGWSGATVYGNALGGAIVTAHTSNWMVSGSAYVQVVTPPDPPVLTHIIVSPDTRTVHVDGAVTYMATGRDQYLNACVNWCGAGSPSWSTDDPHIASVTPWYGDVTGVSPGRTLVRATAGGVSGSAEVLVEEAPVGCPPAPQPCPADPY